MKAVIFQKNLIDNKEKISFDFVNNFNDAEVELTIDSIKIKTKEDMLHNYEIKFSEKDTFTETFLGQFENGTKFRLIKPVGVALEMTKLKSGADDAFSFGSIDTRGWAIHFYLFNN